jgi:DNA-binding PadR family transcriptional regulator
MKLTTTSYAILGLLDARDWTAYELAQQADRSLAFVWPVSASQLYAEPKRLADAGLIRISHAPAGPERTRQVFAIKAAGRRALRKWLASEPAAPRFQAEILLRCLFAPSAPAEDLSAALRATRTAVAESYMAGLRLVQEYLDGDNPFPERTHSNILWMTVVRDLHILLIDWADSAIEQVEGWEDSAHGGDPAIVADQLASLPALGRTRGLIG